MKRKKLEDIDINKFSKKMHSESDRACAILGASLLDAKLENLFTQNITKFQNELLKGTGPITTFSARILLASALSWINEPVQKDLDTIRVIRNDFSHSFDHELSFQNQSIADRCNNLLVAQSYIDGLGDSIGAPDQNLSEHAIKGMQEHFQTPRWRFQLSVDFITQYFDHLPVIKNNYKGSDLLSEVRALSAKIRVKVSMHINVG